MAGKIIADIIEAPVDRISLNVGNLTVLSANSSGLTYIPTGNVNVTIGGANANLTMNILTANGIKFPATQVTSSDGNTLDDYEEGTFTPTLRYDVGTSGVAYSSRVGKYTKIGRQVFVEFQIGLTSKGTGSGEVYLGNLPFTVANDMSSAEPGYVGVTYWSGFSTGVYYLWGFANNLSTDLAFRRTTTTSTAAGGYLVIGDISDTMYFQGSVTYTV
jgi:hypothetical protein